MPIKARLVRRSLSDRPDWQVINDDVPLGKVYTVRPIGMQWSRKATLMNKETGEQREVDTVFVQDESGHLGMMILDVLEVFDGALTTNFERK